MFLNLYQLIAVSTSVTLFLIFCAVLSWKLLSFQKGWPVSGNGQQTIFDHSVANIETSISSEKNVE